MITYDQMGENLANSLTDVEREAFDYLFPLNIDHLVFGKYDNPQAVGSFQARFGTLANFFAYIASKLKADPNFDSQQTKVKATAYELMLSLACIGSLITKKADYVFKGPTYNWAMRTKNPKFMSLQVIFDQKLGYATFMLWDDARKSDYIKIQYIFGESGVLNDYTSRAYSTQNFKFKVIRSNGNARQKTFETTLSGLWKDLKQVVGYITEKTIL